MTTLENALLRSILDRAVKRSCGISADTLRRMPWEDIRAFSEKIHGKKKYPLLTNSDEINKELDEILANPD